MSDQSQDQNAKPEEGQEPEEGKKEEMVAVPKEQFEALMTKLTETNQAIASQSQQQRPQPKEEEDLLSDDDIKDMSPTEAVELIAETVNKRNRPMFDALTYLLAREEVRTCRETFSDFDDYKEEIKKIGQANPGMKLAQAYKIAKADNPKKKKEPEQPPSKPVKKPNVPPSAKPGSTPVTETKTFSAKEAAAKAFEEYANDMEE